MRSAICPEKMKGDEDGKPWAITFAPRQPISVTFADDGFKITIRGVRFCKGHEVHHDPMNISAAYKIEKSAQGFKAVRQGEIQVFPPDFAPGQTGRRPATGDPQAAGKAVCQGLRAGDSRRGVRVARQVEGGRQDAADPSGLPRRLAGDRLEACGRGAEGLPPHAAGTA